MIKDNNKNSDTPSKNDGFKVPEDYFENLPVQIMRSVKMLDGKSEQKNPFSVPGNFFEKQFNIINEKISVRKRRLVFKRSIILIPFACAIIIAGIFIYKNSSDNERRIEYSANELENSIYLQAIDQDLLIDELIATGNSQSNDSLTQYLLDNNIDITDLENAL